MRRATKISAATVGLAVLAVTGTAVAVGNDHSDNDWPYAHHTEASYTVASFLRVPAHAGRLAAPRVQNWRGREASSVGVQQAVQRMLGGA